MKTGDRVSYLGIGIGGTPAAAIGATVVRVCGERCDLHLDGYPNGSTQVYGAIVMDGRAGVVEAEVE